MTREPIFNVPSGVVWAIGAIVAVHVGIWFTGEDQAELLKNALAFIPSRYTGEADRLPGGPWAALWSPVTHQLVHGDLTHLLVNTAWLLAFGGAVAKRIGGARFWLLGIGSGLAGAALFFAIRYGQRVPMVGASGAISGLMGGAFRFLFHPVDPHAMPMGRPDPHELPCMSLPQLLRNRSFLATTGIWIGLNFAMAAAAELITSGAGIAWEAHIGGFLFGLLLFPFVDPPRPNPAYAYLEEPGPRTLH